MNSFVVLVEEVLDDCFSQLFDMTDLSPLMVDLSSVITITNVIIVIFCTLIICNMLWRVQRLPLNFLS